MHLTTDKRSDIGHNMSFRTNSDNKFAKGTLISAQADPHRSLRIVAYYQRIYYCEVVGEEHRKQLVYFERELIAPAV